MKKQDLISKIFNRVKFFDHSTEFELEEVECVLHQLCIQNLIILEFSTRGVLYSSQKEVFDLVRKKLELRNAILNRIQIHKGITKAQLLKTVINNEKIINFLLKELIERQLIYKYKNECVKYYPLNKNGKFKFELKDGSVLWNMPIGYRLTCDYNYPIKQFIDQDHI